MAEAWPVGVNQVVRMEGYNEEAQDFRAEYKPAVGEPFRRRRSTVPNKIFTFTQLLTFTEWDTFETWYETTLKGGVLAFTRNHPRLGASTQITGTWEERPVSGPPVSHNKFAVQMKIRASL